MINCNHTWVERTFMHRICKNCGATQEKGCDSQGCYWSNIKFDIWKSHVDSMLSEREETKNQQIKALEWLKEKEASGGVRGMIEISREEFVKRWLEIYRESEDREWLANGSFDNITRFGVLLDREAWLRVQEHIKKRPLKSDYITKYSKGWVGYYIWAFDDWCDELVRRLEN